MSIRKIVSGIALGVVASVLVNLGGGCLTRPVTPGNTTTFTSFRNGYTDTSIGKVDILFDIDNSSSMGDKQQYLQDAVPDLVTRLVSPNCVDGSGQGIVLGGKQLVIDSSGKCAMGQPEFPPVTDMHIGVITSSLGGRGTTSLCQTPSTPGATPDEYNEYTTGSEQAFLTDEGNHGPYTGLSFISKNNDDQAHLINRSAPAATPNAPPTALSGEFLAWAPSPDAGTPSGGVPERTAQSLQNDFEGLVVGAQAYGCGIESQLESWYRFLVQPDPYATITTTKDQSDLVASWQGVDDTILQQRADFLRPDSLVLIVVLSDENDSEIDVRSIGGIGVNWLDPNFNPPLATSVCSNPSDPNCTSCSLGSHPNDPNCQGGKTYPSDATNWAFYDNLRHVHMKQKYGVDVQFPINRYVNGLTMAKVPNRDGEYPPGGNGFYQGGLNGDPQDLNCDNPLFSTNLPTTSSGPGDPNLCTLAPNLKRTPLSHLVYYAHIGGVPHELLTTTDAQGNVTGKDTLTSDDWKKILGNDPESYDYGGIDPHMIESYQPRAGISVQGSAGAGIAGDEAPDWVTDGTNSGGAPVHANLAVDREYACVFKLATSRSCDATLAGNSEADIASCDCSSTHLASNQVPPVCDPMNPTTQLYAKAYPTVRELLLAEKLGPQGIVSSICPIDVEDNGAHNDPLYGYRPAISAIIKKLKVSLTATCLPETLPQTDAGAVPCLVLVTLPSVTGQDNTVCMDASANPGLAVVDKDILAEYQSDQHDQFLAGNSPVDLSLSTTCQIKQVLPGSFQGTCQNDTDPTVPGSQGWCYVKGEGDAGCTQSLQFSGKGLPSGGIVSLQCLENSSVFGNGTGAAM